MKDLHQLELELTKPSAALIADIKKIDGISDLVANKIYNFFNRNSLISKK